jgi:hypothetical protein
MTRMGLRLEASGVVHENAWGIDADGRLAASADWRIDDPSQASVRVGNAAEGLRSWTIDLEAQRPFDGDMTARVDLSLDDDLQVSHVLWPRYHGVFDRIRTSDSGGGEFRGAGESGLALPDEDRLALPMVVLESANEMWLAGLDPTFSAGIRVAASADAATTVSFSWRWKAAAGVHSRESRRVFAVQVADVASALDRWFELATPDVPPPPDWLHEIALQDYDYLSKNGNGWYRDIDAACDLVHPDERHRALFCLHGWYDQIGRYCYDADTGRLDDTWIAFSQIHHPHLMAQVVKDVSIEPDKWPPAQMGPRNLEKYEPVELDWESMRDRLSYAKQRGFRTAVYLMTGMQGAGNREEHVADGTGLATERGLWQGPDLVGPTYVMNPLHPQVRSLVLGYVEALLDKIGDLTDALVLDEAYYIGYGTLGPDTCPGYADRAQMQLIAEIAALCHGYRPDLAFLTADLLGHPMLEHVAFPYSLAADGIYQDSWGLPQVWDCVRIPTWRSVAWGCCWAPVTNLAFTRWAVTGHEAPVVISNGCFGDDTGLADMQPDVVAQIAELWRQRTRKRRIRRVAVADVSLNGSHNQLSQVPPAMAGAAEHGETE